MLKSGLNHYITPPFFKSIVPNAPGASSVVFNSKVRQTINARTALANMWP